MRFLERLPHWLLGLGIGIAATASLIAARGQGALESFEFAVYDALVARTSVRIDSGSSIALIEVREEDLRLHGHPLSDAVLAQALRAALRLGPRAVGVDLFRDRPIAPGSEALERVVGADSRVVMIEKLDEEGSGAVAPPAFLRGAPQVGFVDIVRDADGRVRRGLVTMDANGATGVSFALRLALRSLIAERRRVPISWRGKTLLMGGRPVSRFSGHDGAYTTADPRGYQVLLDFRRRVGLRGRHSLDDLLRGRVSEAALRDRVVLFGSSAESARDEHVTPVGTLPGVELHAALIDQLLRSADGKAGVRTLSRSSEHALIASLGILAGLLAGWLRSPVRLLIVGSAGLSVIALLAIAAFERSLWLPAAPAGLASIAAGGATVAVLSFRERAERGRVMELFGRFVSPDLAGEIWKRRDEFIQDGRPRSLTATVTVLASDLAGYTSAGEKLEPAALMEWINGYLDALATVISSRHGLVDDYAGDGIKADFGVPIPRETEEEISADAEAAVQSAIEMAAEVERLNRVANERGLPTARMRIGVVTGPAVLGMVGSSHRLKYTTVGDTVNAAARLEAYDKESFARASDVVRILVSESTRARLGPQYLCEEVGNIQLPGKTESVRIHRVWPPTLAVGRSS